MKTMILALVAAFTLSGCGHFAHKSCKSKRSCDVKKENCHGKKCDVKKKKSCCSSKKGHHHKKKK